MTIDERLDRFTERHEDLTRTVEFLARTTHEHTQQIGDIVEAAARLLHVAQIREQRLTRLEGGEHEQ
jgi:hypothetical protein